MTTRKCTLHTPAGPVQLAASYHVLHGERLSGGIEYRGTIEALFAAGALTPDMLKMRMSRGRGDPRHMATRSGHWFRINGMYSYRTGAWTKRTRGTVRVEIRGLDMALPGMRELYPGGLPTVLPCATWRDAVLPGERSGALH